MIDQRHSTTSNMSRTLSAPRKKALPIIIIIIVVVVVLRLFLIIIIIIIIIVFVYKKFSDATNILVQYTIKIIILE